MFCYQCEQTVNCQGCQGGQGVCGKSAAVADLQDVLNELTKGVAWLATQSGEDSTTINRFLVDALFTTVTNVNFDESRIEDLIQAGASLRQSFAPAGDCEITGVNMKVSSDNSENLEIAKTVSIRVRQDKFGATVAGLQEVIFYGLKGAAAYLHHARVLGVEDNAIYKSLRSILAFLAAEPAAVDQLLSNALATGELNYKAMELLDRANTSTYGDPEPTEVSSNPQRGEMHSSLWT